MSHPANGIYENNGLGYISVSDILGRTMPLFNPSKASGIDWWRRNEPNAAEILERGQIRGTLLHGEIELSLAGVYNLHKDSAPTYEQMVSFNIPEYVLYLKPLLDEIRRQNPCLNSCQQEEGECSVLEGGECLTRSETLLIEKPIFSPYGWAGTPDLRLNFDGQYTIWDWKSVRSYKEDGVQKKAKSMSHYSEAFIQIAAYALAHNLLAKKHPKMLPITQGVVCVCYDWREPHVHVLTKGELKEAVETFIERYKVYQDLVKTKFPIKL